MENWENQNFEAEWRKAFKGAEVTPSDAVWDAINMRSMHIENITMRKRVVFYQRLAAASVAILFLFSGYFLLKPSDQSSNQDRTITKATIEQSIPKLTASGETNVQSGLNATTENQNAEGTIASDPSSKTGSNSEVASEKGVVPKNTILKTDNQGTIPPKNFQANVSVISNPQTYVALETKEDESNKVARQNDVRTSRKYLRESGPIASVHPLPVKSMLLSTVQPNDYSIAYRVADARPVVNRSKKKSNPPENVWAAVGFAAGNFSSNATGGELLQANRSSDVSSLGSQPMPFETSNRSTTAENSKPGISMAYTLSAGKRIFKKWVLQGGITYLNQSANSTASIPSVAPANQFLGSKNSNDSYSPETTFGVTYMTQNEIKSTTQFISIPIQAGYMILDRKIGIQINGGLAPDIFLKNSIYESGDPNGSGSSTTGTNETYKAMSLTGLGGLEVSYQLSKHYRISLVPGFRYSLTQVYKDASLASSKPFVADIGLRFRYLFSN